MHTIRRVLVSAGWLWLALLHPARVSAQTSFRSTLRTPAQGQLTDGTPAYSTPESSNEDVLLGMANRASVIFVGTVTAVHKPGDDLLRSGSAGAVVEVDFQVERSVRGTTTGSGYVMREWAGMWRDNPRFLPGQRLLMLLHAPGPGGLSSPVDGLDGAIPVRGGGLTPTAALTARGVHPETGATTLDDQVDMRWLQAKTLKTMSYADAPGASPGVTPVNTVADPATASSTAETAVQGGSSGDGASDPLSRILGLLGAVQALNLGVRSASN